MKPANLPEDAKDITNDDVDVATCDDCRYLSWGTTSNPPDTEYVLIMYWCPRHRPNEAAYVKFYDHMNAGHDICSPPHEGIDKATRRFL